MLRAKNSGKKLNYQKDIVSKPVLTTFYTLDTMMEKSHDKQMGR